MDSLPAELQGSPPTMYSSTFMVSSFICESWPQLQFLVWDSNLNLHFKIPKAVKKELDLLLTESLLLRGPFPSGGEAGQLSRCGARAPPCSGSRCGAQASGTRASGAGTDADVNEPVRSHGAELTAGLSGGALILSTVLRCSSPLLPVGLQTSLQAPLSLSKQPLSSLVSFLGSLPLAVLHCDGGVHSHDAKISFLSLSASISHPFGASWN